MKWTLILTAGFIAGFYAGRKYHKHLNPPPPPSVLDRLADTLFSGITGIDPTEIHD